MTFFSNCSLTAASFDALVGSIGAVLISVALPALRHTHVGARTLESLRTAGLGFCGNDIMGELRNVTASCMFSQQSQWPWKQALSHQ